MRATTRRGSPLSAFPPRHANCSRTFQVFDASHTTTSLAPASAVSPSQILLVEDDRTAAHALCQLLSEEGFLVVCASDGLEGLSLLHRMQPDLLITDLQLPRLSGLELCRFATRLGYPVITMSAYSYLEGCAQHAGAHASFCKPLDFADCAAAARRVLSQ